MGKKWTIVALGLVGLLALSYFCIRQHSLEASPSLGESSSAPVKGVSASPEQVDSLPDVVLTERNKPELPVQKRESRGCILNQSGRKYFEEMSVSKWTDGGSPCLLMQIEERTISAKVDLGFSGYFSISRDMLKGVKEKKLLGTRTMYGVQKKKYEEKVFEFPEVRMSNISLYDVPVQEESEEFHKNSCSNKDGSLPYSPEPGRIGWKAFQITNVLLDLNRDKIVFCDSFSVLKNKGYSLDSFVKTDLLLDNGLIAIKAKTQEGILNCVFDTACTLNLLHTDSLDGVSLHDCLWNPEGNFEFAQFQIGDQKFGSLSFQRIYIDAPFPIYAVLGMEFFQNHIVYLDFPNHAVYIAPAKTTTLERAARA